MFIQSIIDYIEIIFEAFSDSGLDYQLILTVLVKRSDLERAVMITDLIYKKLDKDVGGNVMIQELVELCEKDL